ncbi:M48 family metallopeptidase [Jatrophihabitans fulvus]
MNFFERQDAARGSSTKLVVLFVLAVVAIVAVVDVATFVATRWAGYASPWGWVATMSAITVLLIGGGTLTKLVALRGGGAAVAQSVGAVPVDPTSSDPRLRRFVNVVEEMSIASGVPMPRLFVLEREQGINAFAAGYRPDDAAIAVTAGALERLDRDELQGVIGHEFSHVLNGDMRLNVRLIGLLYGILLLALVGSRFLMFGGGRSRDSKGNPLLIIALLFVVVGFVGQFFARLIQAAVSRQREWLADASAVQFTRQTVGLEGALRKIAGLPEGSALADRHSEQQVGHMLFGEGRARFSSLFATHPPLEERIAALTGVPVEQITAPGPGAGQAPPAAAGFGGPSAATDGVAGPPPVALHPPTVSARVGTLTHDDISRGARLNDRIPARARALAEQRSTAVPLVLALLLDPRPDVRQAELAAVARELGPQAAGDADAIATELAGLDRALALPLAHLAVPQVVTRPEPERAAVARAVDGLVHADGRVSAFEYSLSRLLTVHLVGPPRPARASVAAVDAAVTTLLAVVAASGNADPAAAERAFAAGTAVALGGEQVAFRPPAQPWDALDSAWPLLASLPPSRRRALVEGVVTAVADDGRVTVAEAELLRVTCGVLGCPLPPLLD